MSNLTRYYWLRMWRTIGVGGALGVVAVGMVLGLAWRDFPPVCQRVVLLAMSVAGGALPRGLFQRDEADLCLPFGRGEVFAARTMASVALLGICLLASPFLVLASLGTEGLVGLRALLAKHAMIGLCIQIAACHLMWLPERKLLGTIAALALGVGLSAVLVRTCSAGASSRAFADLLVFGGAGVLAALLVGVSRRMYVTGRVWPAPGDRYAEPGAETARHLDRGWLSRRVTERRRVHWLLVVLGRERVLRLPHVVFAVIILPMVCALWSANLMYYVGFMAMVMCAMRYLWQGALALEFLPVSRRTLFRLASLPLLTVVLLGALCSIPMWSRVHLKPWSLSESLPYVETIRKYCPLSVASSQDGLRLRDDTGYERRATGERRWFWWTFNSYEFDGADPPSFAVFQTQRFFREVYSVRIARAELLAAYRRGPTEWLSAIDRKYGQERVRMVARRKLVGLGLLAGLCTLGILINTHSGTPHRLGCPLLCLVCGVMFGVMVAELLGCRGGICIAHATLCDVVFEHPWLAVAVWLALCGVIYRQAENCFEQMEAPELRAR